MGEQSTYYKIDIFFLSNHNIHKCSCVLCFWASDPLIDRFYQNLSIKGSEAQKQRPHEFLWMLWFDEKSISNLGIGWNHVSIHELQLIVCFRLEVNNWIAVLGQLNQKFFACCRDWLQKELSHWVFPIVYQELKNGTLFTVLTFSFLHTYVVLNFSKTIETEIHT